MDNNHVFHTRTALAIGLKALFKELEDRLSLRKPLVVYLAGGMAVHLYTSSRVTTDVDAEFGGRVILPNDLMVDVTLENGVKKVIYFDTNYNSSFALLHENYLDDSIPVPELEFEHIRVHVLSPVDLAVSKIARFADNDKEDIRELVRLGLTDAIEIEKRANLALDGYIGNIPMLRLNIRDAVALARDAAPIDSEIQPVADAFNSVSLPSAEQMILLEAAHHAEPKQTYYGGIVFAMESERIVQDSGRGQLIVHQAGKLDVVPVVGSKVKIAYDADGLGAVTPLLLAKGAGVCR